MLGGGGGAGPVLPLLLVGGVFGLAYWCLGTFAVLRRYGTPRRVRLGLAGLAALGTAALLSMGR